MRKSVVPPAIGDSAYKPKPAACFGWSSAWEKKTVRMGDIWVSFVSYLLLSVLSRCQNLKKRHMKKIYVDPWSRFKNLLVTESASKSDRLGPGHTERERRTFLILLLWPYILGQ